MRAGAIIASGQTLFDVANMLRIPMSINKPDGHKGTDNNPEHATRR